MIFATTNWSVRTYWHNVDITNHSKGQKYVRFFRPATILASVFLSLNGALVVNQYWS